MSNRLILCTLLILSTALMSLPSTEAQTFPVRGLSIPISSYDDDPFASDSVVERMSATKFDLGEDGRPILSSNLIWLEDESKIFSRNVTTGEYHAFAWNPWLPELRKSNERGDFRFLDEPRFPLHKVERGPDGKIVLRDGLQVWLPQDLHRGMTTVFEAANASKEAVESWSRRELSWGNDGSLYVNAHAFIDFNAFWSPTGQALFFGVVPYRPRGQQDISMFETATSWELAAHESGHALHHALKPNTALGDPGNGSWGESFGDQVAMWASLQDSDRLLKLLADTNGNLNQSNSITRMAEVLAALIGSGTGLRDAFHDKKVSDTDTEVHDRSEVLTGAVYKIFLAIYDGLKYEHGPVEGLKKAGEIMGTFLTRSADFAPENMLTLGDIAKGYLKVDKEFFEYRYNAILVDEFTRRELLDADSLSQWLAHEAAIPALHLPPRPTDARLERFLQANLNKLGIGPDFGLKLQSVTSGNRLKKAKHLEETIVRVQLTQGRGDDATLLANHGILVFRKDGTLADYHAPLTPGGDTQMVADSFAQAQAVDLLSQAKELRLDQYGAPLSIVRRPDGKMTAEVRVIRGEGLNAYMQVFTPENLRGERRENLIPPVPPNKRINIPDSLLK